MAVLCLVTAAGLFVGGVDALAVAIIVVLVIAATLGIGVLTIVNSLGNSSWLEVLGWIAFFLGACGLYVAVGMQVAITGSTSGPIADAVKVPMTIAAITGMGGLALVYASRGLDAWRLGDRKRAVGTMLLVIAMAVVLVFRRS